MLNTSLRSEKLGLVVFFSFALTASYNDEAHRCHHIENEGRGMKLKNNPMTEVITITLCKVKVSSETHLCI